MFSAYTKEFRYNWHLAAPVIMGMLGHTFVGLVDNLMVGQLGAAELAAVSLGNSFFFVAMSLGIGFSTAITPLVAEADSEGNFCTWKICIKTWNGTMYSNCCCSVCYNFTSQTIDVYDESARRSSDLCLTLFGYDCSFINSINYFSSVKAI